MDKLNQFNINRPMAPLWIRYPDMEQFSMGWRMGYGESYKDMLWNWFNTLTKKEQAQYRALFPAPILWPNHYEKDSLEEVYENHSFWHHEYDLYFWQENGLPLYDLKKIQKKYNQGAHLKYVFFWGNQSNNAGTLTKSCLSQWWPSNFEVSDISYNSMEQYMMAEKARLFNDEKILEKIMESKDPKEIKALGRKVKGFQESIWNQVKHTIILTGSYYKFTQNPDLRGFLLGTKDRILVEASPLDRIWGIRLEETDERCKNPNLWEGENRLGFALMEVRDEIKRVYENEAMIPWEIMKELD